VRRRLLNLLTALSLLLCVAVVVLWVRSRFVSDRLMRATQTDEDITPQGMSPLPWSDLPVRLSAYEAGQIRGVLFVEVARYRLMPPHGLPHTQLVYDIEAKGRFNGWTRRPPQDFRPYPGGSFLNRLGFSGSAKSVDMTGQQGFEAWFTAPHWFLVLLFVCLPAVRLGWSLRRRTNVGSGICPSCGYDLRATPGRCPECGSEPACVG